LDLKPTDIEGPLSQFNHTKAEKEDTRRLIHTINQAMEGQVLGPDIVDDAFEQFWPALHERLAGLPPANADSIPRRSIENMVEEILGLIRAQSFKQPSPFTGHVQTPRLISTLDFTPEEAQIINEHYEYYLRRLEKLEGNLTGAKLQITLRNFLKRLETDPQFAREVLVALKEGEIYPSLINATKGDSISVNVEKAQDENSDS
ncbi:MAG TPA: hypothetical protein VNZ44_06860, partial [Pyrinomonadaceae bacterium]|nr:hypothetical protein [Pyrinomonadaceae bacterium]